MARGPNLSFQPIAEISASHVSTGTSSLGFEFTGKDSAKGIKLRFAADASPRILLSGLSGACSCDRFTKQEKRRGPRSDEMIARLFVGSVVALGLMASPVFAQPVPNPEDNNPQAMHHDTMTHHDMSRHSRMDMGRMSHDRMSHDRMSHDRMARWCHSMSYRRMMREPRCRMMMHMHHSDRMHHM